MPTLPYLKETARFNSTDVDHWGTMKWTIYGSKSANEFPYDDTFRSLLTMLGHQNFNGLLLSREPGQRHVLDLMAPVGSFLEGLYSLDRGYALTLPQGLKYFPPSQNPNLVTIPGSVLDQSSWAKIPYNIDLAVCRPVAGISNEDPSGIYIAYKLLINTLPRLSPNEGTFFLELGNMPPDLHILFSKFSQKLLTNNSDWLQVYRSGSNHLFRKIAQGQITGITKQDFRQAMFRINEGW